MNEEVHVGCTWNGWKWLPLALMVPLALGACDDEEITDPVDGTANVSVYLTDAPGDVEAAWVEILEIYLQGGPGRVDLLGEPTGLVLLTDLVGTSVLLVEDAEVDPTMYGQLRLVVGDAVLVSTEGTVYVKGDPELPEGLEGAEMGNLNCPSCSTSGLKVVIPNDEAGDQVEVDDEAMAFVLDFNVSESFGHRAGNSGNWNMHPVIHGTIVVDQDGDGTAADELTSLRGIEGTVALGLGAESNPVVIPECPAGTPRSVEDFIPTATSQGLVNAEGEAIVRTGNVAPDGSFRIDFLASDTYSLGYIESLALEGPQLDFTASVDPTEATVDAGDATGVTFTIEAAECVGDEP